MTGMKWFHYLCLSFEELNLVFFSESRGIENGGGISTVSILMDLRLEAGMFHVIRTSRTEPQDCYGSHP